MVVPTAMPIAAVPIVVVPVARHEAIVVGRAVVVVLHVMAMKPHDRLTAGRVVVRTVHHRPGRLERKKQ